MRKFIHDFRIGKNTRLTPGLHLLELQLDGADLPDIRPGQFVNVAAPESSGKLLRRPISICDVDYSRNTLTLLVKIAGAGTEAICAHPEGALLNLVYPLGNGFRMPEKRGKMLLVGGGVGIAPLLYLSRLLCERGDKVTILLGGRSKSDLQLLSQYEKYGELCITTQDGSAGICGMVTDHEAISRSGYEMAFCCGPRPMMKAVGEICATAGVDCQVSLENSMACGIGACLCCVEKTADGHNTCVCTKGPVFNYSELETRNRESLNSNH